MKKAQVSPVSLLCIGMALLLLASSVGVSLLPASHNCCAREGCTICLLTSFMKRLLHGILAVASTVSVIGLFGSRDRITGRRPKYPYPATDTPVELMDKLSN